MTVDPIRGRGTAHNLPNRFDPLHYEHDPARVDPDAPSPTTQFLRDTSRSLITTNDSPDVGFHASINPYRGCEHGCIYCYARPTHEYLGFSAGLDFESRILVKEDAPELLRRELASKRWKPMVVVISGVTDCYQPIERRLQLTRKCLEVFLEFRNPVAIVTKSHLVTRDTDLLSELAKFDASAVFLSITTLDGDLARVLEPRAAQPAGRLAAIEELTAAGVPTGVLVAPVIPGLTDHELPAIITAAVRAGARFAGHVPLRLPGAVAPLFEQWLMQHFPDRKDKVLGRIRSMRGGKLNDARFGSRMKGDGVFAEMMDEMFALACRKAGVVGRSPELSVKGFRRPGGTQGLLFEE
ncbi:MAG: PA0069 family radical SAM protein [Gemmataceae bacterium]|nr:PA0069 family radical SAM protein [Gemmataceae bacterium]